MNVGYMSARYTTKGVNMLSNNIKSFIILETDDGFMVQNRSTGEYLEDDQGNNCFDVFSNANDLLEAQFYAE